MKRSLLLVEDEMITAMINKKSLGEYGYLVTSVSTGEKAVEYLNQFPGIDLVLMDIDLGEGLDGTQTAERILELHDIPIIFLSSHTEPEVVEKTAKIASYGYAVKDSPVTVLDALIKMALKLFDAKKSEQKKEAILHENEERYRLLHENAGIAIGYYSLEGKVLFYNKLAAKNRQGVPEDFVGKSVSEIFPDTEAEMYANRIRKAALSNSPIVYHDVIPLSTGNLYYLNTFVRITDIQGTLLGVQVISQDVTVQKQAEEDLQKKSEGNAALHKHLESSLEELRSAYEEIRLKKEELETSHVILRRHDSRMTKILKSTSDVIVIVDKDGLVTYKSPNIEKLFGWTPEDLVGESSIANIHPEDLPQIQKIINALIQKPDISETTQCRYRCKDGTFKWIEITATNLYEDPDVQGLLGNYHDITTQKNASDEIKALLAEKELILKEVHHRIKNNMNTIYGLLLLQAGTLKDSVAVNALEVAANRVKSMQHLYDKLYRAVASTELSVQDYLPALIDEIVKNFPNVKNITIDKRIDDFTLSSKILQPLGIIINELMSNIMKYAFTGKDSGHILIEAEETGPLVKLTLADDGNGLPESVTFENSTGFGLVLVKGLAQQIGGTIRIERVNGTRFVLEFMK